MEKYQTIGPRFVALFIDGLIMIPVGLLAMLVPSAESFPKTSIVANIVISAVPIMYTVLLHGLYGKTVGKSAVDIKVVDISERPITFTQAVIRSLPQMLPLFITTSLLISVMPNALENESSKDFLKIITTTAYVLYFAWYIADIIVCLVSEKKRALHDLIAGTVVVRTDSNRVSVTP